MNELSALSQLIRGLFKLGGFALLAAALIGFILLVVLA